MRVTRQQAQSLKLVERREFVSASGGLGFKGAERKQINGLVERTLQAHEYLRRSKKDKGIVRRSLAKISGFSSSLLLVDLFQLVSTITSQFVP